MNLNVSPKQKNIKFKYYPIRVHESLRIARRLDKVQICDEDSICFHYKDITPSKF